MSAILQLQGGNVPLCMDADALIICGLPTHHHFACLPAGLTGPAAAQWLSALKQFLKESGGQTELTKLGGVKKPEGVMKGQKLKAFLLQHPKHFTVDGNTVSAKK